MLPHPASCSFINGTLYKHLRALSTSRKKKNIYFPELIPQLSLNTVRKVLSMVKPGRERGGHSKEPPAGGGQKFNAWLWWGQPLVHSGTRSTVLTYYSYYPEEQAHPRLSLLFCGTGSATETDCHTHTDLAPEKLSPQSQFTLSRWGRAGTRTQRAPGSWDGGVGRGVSYRSYTSLWSGALGCSVLQGEG